MINTIAFENVIEQDLIIKNFPKNIKILIKTLFERFVKRLLFNNYICKNRLMVVINVFVDYFNIKL